MELLVEKLVAEALESLRCLGKIPAEFRPLIVIERPKREEFGDFGTALPLAMARALKRKPAECAADLIAAIAAPEGIFTSIEFAPPGYVNFRITPSAWFSILKGVFESPLTYGASDAGHGLRVLLEYVSANPTGPLHVGHGRGAVLGDALARLMRTAGYHVDTEYYINDVGNQMALLGRSLWARGRELLGLPVVFPENGYHGDYIRDLAAAFVQTPDGRIACEQDYETLPGASDRNIATDFASQRLLSGIRATLDKLGITFDRYFSERGLHESGRIAEVIKLLKERDAIYEANGALLFRMGGEDEDRVVVRPNGIPTYFASDIAYHDDKVRRGYDRLINIWGADHHGYIPRMRASLMALGHDPAVLEVILVQMVTLTRSGVVVPLSKRTGHFVTLEEVADEVGTDAVRFLFLLRRADAQMEFDLELAKAKTMENPVFYVQYGHARIASILRKAASQGISPPPFSPRLADALTLPEEQALVRALTQLPAVIASSARNREPHHIAFYLTDLVKGFHSYYTRYKHTEKVISQDVKKTEARLFLVWCLKAVLARGLDILGVSAPEEMHYEGDDEQS